MLHKKSIRSIPTSKLARGFKMASLTASVGASALTGKVAGLFSGAAEKELKNLLSQVKQAQKIADTLSQMKGAAMKLGQILSIHGEHLFPKEVVAVLAKLQGQSDQMEFARIEKVLVRELGPRLGKELVDVSREPIAAASIGQVHRAAYRHEGKGAKIDVAVKVQYPGVDKSIDSDVDALASLLSVLTRFPSVEGFNALTDEIKTILRQETDYGLEAKNNAFFRDYFKDDPHVVVPRPFLEVSTPRVLVTELVGGLSVQEFADSTASDEARAFLGKKFLEVFYTELFKIGKVQTDPNFANYKVRWSFGVSEPGLVLLDFGATKAFDEAFRRQYAVLAQACLDDDYGAIRDEAVRIGFLKPEDSKELVDLHYELARLLVEPFHASGPYDWGSSDLAERVRKLMPKFIFAFKLRPPPKDFVFLNRKLVGAYFFCSAIGARFSPRPLLESFVEALLKNS